MKPPPTAPALSQPHESVEQFFLRLHLRSHLRFQISNLKSLSLFEVIRCQLLQQ